MMDMESESTTTTYRPRLPKTLPILQTNAGKLYLLIGLACVLVVVVGIGFVLYTVRLNIKHYVESFKTYNYRYIGRFGNDKLFL